MVNSPTKNISSAMLRGARKILRWDQTDLSCKAQVSLSSIRMYETDKSTFTQQSVNKILITFNQHGLSIQGRKIVLSQELSNQLYDGFSDFPPEYCLCALNILGWKRKELAEKLGISVGSIRKYENRQKDLLYAAKVLALQLFENNGITFCNNKIVVS